jgi:tetratricopeptide (TPR) repeat protein
VDRLARATRTDQAAKRYDFIYEDIFHDCAVPFLLVTREFNDKIAGLLADDGVFMIHLPEAYPQGRLLGPVVNTMSETFSHVYVVVEQADLQSAQHLCVVVAAKGELDPQAILQERSKRLKFLALDAVQIADLKERCGGRILTDDYAPVENLLTSLVQQSATDILARKYFDKARGLQSQNQPEASIRSYRQALDLDSSLAVEAYEQIGLISLARSKPQEAADSFRRALAAHAQTGCGQRVIGAVHMHLGLLLARTDQLREGKEQLAQALDWLHIELEENPGNVVLWEQLGETSAALGDFKGTSDAFEKAVALEPRNPSHYQKLARALEFQQRYDEAVAVVRQHVQLAKEQGRRDLESQLTQYMDVLKYNKVKHANK